MKQDQIFFKHSWWQHIKSNSLFIVMGSCQSEPNNTESELEIWLIFMGNHEFEVRTASAMHELLKNKEIKQIVNWR